MLIAGPQQDLPHVIALHETIRLMGEIDAVTEQRGGFGLVLSAGYIELTPARLHWKPSRKVGICEQKRCKRPWNLVGDAESG
jgi:hypothetical protein